MLPHLMGIPAGLETNGLLAMDPTLSIVFLFLRRTLLPKDVSCYLKSTEDKGSDFLFEKFSFGRRVVCTFLMSETPCILGPRIESTQHMFFHEKVHL